MITAGRPEHPAAEPSNETRDPHRVAAERPSCARDLAEEARRMIPELGHYALMLALGLALIQAIMPIVGTRTGDAVLMNMATPTAWTILLAILTFSLSLIGTFLVRSGVLTSVHAFATDPMRGVFILAILVIFIGGGLALYGWRATLLKQGGLFAPISREGALVFNNLFLTTACASVFIGTLYPLALEALTGAKISVGPPFFNATFGPLFIPLMVVMPFGPLMGWKRGDLFGAAQRLLVAAILAALAMAAAFAIEHGGPVLAPFGAGIAVFVMAGAGTGNAGRNT